MQNCLNIYSNIQFLLSLNYNDMYIDSYKLHISNGLLYYIIIDFIQR